MASNRIDLELPGDTATAAVLQRQETLINQYREDMLTSTTTNQWLSQSAHLVPNNIEIQDRHEGFAPTWSTGTIPTASGRGGGSGRFYDFDAKLTHAAKTIMKPGSYHNSTEDWIKKNLSIKLNLKQVGNKLVGEVKLLGKDEEVIATDSDYINLDILEGNL